MSVFFTEMWERFSFYGMKALLFLYLIKYHLFGDTSSYQLLGAYGGMVYAMPVIGGMLADRWLGMRKAVVAGGVLLCLGHFGMAFEGEQARIIGGEIQRDESALQVFYFFTGADYRGCRFPETQYFHHSRQAVSTKMTHAGIQDLPFSMPALILALCSPA